MARTSSKPGKRVGGALYVHADALPFLLVDEQRRVEDAAGVAGADANNWNVAKLPRDENKVSLLTYPGFFDKPFPALSRSVSVNLATRSVRTASYAEDGDPPILHRKELLLPFDHPDRAQFAALTEQLESRGLLREAKRIGRGRAWLARFEAAGLRIEDHALVADGVQGRRSAETGSVADVARHKTAISRSSLSTPMQALARHGFLDGDYGVFDYGCGRGNDLHVLRAAGLEAYGWDPHYAPEAPKRDADVVNLGYVLNVIEEPAERTAALDAAFSLTQRVLAVAVLTTGRGDVSDRTPYRDGFLTSRNTFQKYFSQAEARELIAETTGEEAIPAAPGVFFAFRDKLAEQRFLEGRSRCRRDISHLLAIQPPPSAPKRTKTDALIAEHRGTIEAVWTRALELGRVPAIDELGTATAGVLEGSGLSTRKAISLAQRIADASALTEARAQRTADLRVYFALNLFNRRRKYVELPAELQHDIKAFFGSHAEGESAGRRALYEVGDPEVILDSCREAAQRGIGYLFEEHSLNLHVELVPRLPEVLRIYVGCAEVLFGAINGDSADLVKIHTGSGKLTLLRYDDFFGNPLPRLTERIKIKMRERDVDYFDYQDDNRTPLLIMKSRYMATDQGGYDRQRAFDDQIAAANIIDVSDYAPNVEDLSRMISARGYRVDGFDLVPVNRRQRDNALLKTG